MKIATRKKLQQAETPFESLVQDALRVEREWRAQSTVAACKLTAAAFQREADQIAHINQEQRAKLRAQIDSATDMPHLQQVLRKMTAFIRTPNCTRPTAEMRRLRFLTSDAADGQMAVLGSNVFQLFALAVERCADKYPDAFGLAESTEGHKQKLAELAQRRDELFAQIGVSYKPEDLMFDDVDATGRARVAFRVSNGRVPIYPRENAGERLVALTLDREDQEQRR